MGQFDGEPVSPVPFNEREVNIIRGKSLMMGEAGKEVRKLCFMIDWFEQHLDELDSEDTFGTEGWRHAFGIGD